MSSTLLGLLARHWEPGKVKARLAATLGESHAATFHALCITALADRFAAVADSRLLAFSPARAEQAFRSVARGRWHLVPQSSTDPAERLRSLLTTALAQAERVVIVSDDCPDLPRELVADGFAALDTADMVIGPTPDGGWHLVGAARGGESLLAHLAGGFPVAEVPGMTRLATWHHADDEAQLREFLSNQKRGPVVDPALRMLAAQVETLLRNCLLRHSRAG
ncbi:MAG: DUF2064 domain-containing protein [Pirellulaceae bacterium]|nr:DUF2064 domain-containing protein [Pirellulaceae bacterium]